MGEEDPRQALSKRFDQERPFAPADLTSVKPSLAAVDRFDARDLHLALAMGTPRPPATFEEVVSNRIHNHNYATSCRRSMI